MRLYATKEYVGTKARIEVIAGSPKVTAIEIHDPSMVGTVGFDAKVMEVFARHGVSYILKATNAKTVVEAYDQDDAALGEHAKLHISSCGEAAGVCAV